MSDEKERDFPSVTTAIRSLNARTVMKVPHPSREHVILEREGAEAGGGIDLVMRRELKELLISREVE